MMDSSHNNEEEPMSTQESSDKIVNDEISNKRIREETSDSENDLPLKRARMIESSSDKESSSIDTKKIISSSDSNNDMKKEDNDQNKDENSESKPNNVHEEEVNKSEKMDDTEATESTPIKGNKSREKQNYDCTQVNETNTIKASEEPSKHDSSVEREKKDQSMNDDRLKKETKKTKKKNEESEIINGVELTVECASENENDSECSVKENTVPRLKTQIIREQPNDSEVDASSSETEKSDNYQILEAKSESNDKATPTKQTQKRGRKKSSAKEVGSESDSNTDGENNSPVVKKKTKNTLSPQKTTEVKRGRGRPRGRPPKNSVKSTKKVSEDESEKKRDTSSDETENKKYDKSTKTKDSDKADSKTEDSAEEKSDEKSSDDSNESEDVKKGKRRKPSKRNIKKIENLKKYIRAAGIRVKCYTTLLKGCDTDAAKAKHLTEFLHEHGVIGRPTLEKCKKIREKNETLKEIEELDTSSIIVETTRSTRGRIAKKAKTETKVETKILSSPDQKKASETLKRIKAVADSDSE